MAQNHLEGSYCSPLKSPGHCFPFRSWYSLVPRGASQGEGRTEISAFTIPLLQWLSPLHHSGQGTGIFHPFKVVHQNEAMHLKNFLVFMAFRKMVRSVLETAPRLSAANSLWSTETGERLLGSFAPSPEYSSRLETASCGAVKGTTPQHSTQAMSSSQWEQQATSPPGHHRPSERGGTEWGNLLVKRTSRGSLRP